MLKVNLLLLLFFVGYLEAEVWSCPNGAYSTKQGEECKQVASSVYCGNGGNKFISPLKNQGDLEVQTCAETNEWRSPFVDLELAKMAPEKRPEKKLQSSRSSSGKDSNTSILADNPILDQYKEIFESYGKILNPFK